MIKFQQNDLGLDLIAAIVARHYYQNLPDTLYVFGANDNRPAYVYISPNIPKAALVANFLTNRLGVSVWAEDIGNPPQKNWVAFHKKLRDVNPQLCCRICLFVEKAIHNLLIW